MMAMTFTPSDTSTTTFSLDGSSNQRFDTTFERIMDTGFYEFRPFGVITAQSSPAFKAFPSPNNL